MAENSGGNGLLGVLVGAMLVGLLVVGFFAMNGGFGQREAKLDVNIEAPQIPAPNSGG